MRQRLSSISAAPQLAADTPVASLSSHTLLILAEQRLETGAVGAIPIVDKASL